MSARRLGLRLSAAVTVLALISSVSTLAVPAAAKGPTKMLGRDAKGDAPGGLDLRWLAVGRFRHDLGVMLGLQDINAAARLHTVAHAAWSFAVDKRTFLLEMRNMAGRPQFDLYERTPAGYILVATGLEGAYDTLNGFIGVLVPMDLVGAKTGSVVSGADDDATKEDARTRLGVADITVSFDGLDTTRSFVLPAWD
ncbi:MAG: hypothetical protein M3277_05200 [Actinomycetota bacterium]|nr:hypothetical protein [Actinomycetota bacterium]